MSTIPSFNAGAEATGEAAKGLLEQIQPQKEQAKARQCLPQGSPAAAGPGDAQDHAHREDGQRQGTDLEAAAHHGHQPAGYGGAHIGAENHGNGLGESQHTGIDEADGGHRNRA